MLAETGFIALILATCFALLQSYFAFRAVAAPQSEFFILAKHSLYGQYFFILLSFAILVVLFINNDFTVSYVANHSNLKLPLFYRISAAWGAHEGSLLLWMVLLVSGNVLILILNQNAPRILIARLLTILGLVCTAFFLFILFTSHPFIRDFSPIRDGFELNPLLQDPGLALHPPMLYSGYVGSALVFAFAMAGLWQKELNADLIQRMQPFLRLAWCCLTLGITLGSWWAYRELGWGGYWFWDPVENASLMPWLLETALLHTLIVTKQRGLFKNWLCLLAILTFAMSLLGTFLVRSGVLVSVHTFAADPARGIFLLILFMAVIGSSLLLYATRASFLTQEGDFAIASKEFFFLINNMLLTAAAFTVLIGTLYPLIADVLHLGKISVGPPYFKIVFVPLAIIVFVSMSVGIHLNWQKTQFNRYKWHLGFIIFSLLCVYSVYNYTSERILTTSVGISSALLILLSLVLHCIELRWRFSRVMTLAHLGIACIILGVTISSGYGIEKDLRLKPGDSDSIHQYQFQFIKMTHATGPNYTTERAQFSISSPHTFSTLFLYPEKRTYDASKIALAETAISATLWRDIYMALGEELDNNTWSVRIYYKPMVRFIWLGGLLMAFAATLALYANIRKVRKGENHV